jgi:quinol-cytochrome oxidoreductase complex cytochrome b subunit/mono/diheme cytochrome c family protein
MTSLLNWLDSRTGIRSLSNAALYEHIPGGARWRYVWGSTLMFAFAVQMITGFFLWAAYSPSSQTAWESVYYIQHQMWGGAVLRGIHHFTAQTMIVLLGLHMLQVIIDGAYRAPREVNFWIGIILLNLVLATALTGYLLPWDQKGYWSTKVATSLIAVVPYVGESLQRLVVGGPNYGHHTLTRFFAVHAGLLPFLMMVFIGAHVYVFRRHGLRHKTPPRSRDTTFWPDQVLRDAVACLGVLLFVLILVFRFYIIPGGDHHIGAELGAPADPSEQFAAARPEWYFLFLFQFLKLPFFAGPAEVYGAVVIPAIILLLLLLMPIVGRWRVGHWLNVAFTVFLATGMVLLTAMAILEDAGGPRLRVPWLAQLPPDTLSAVLCVLLGVTLVLVPLFTRERSFRFNVITLGLLILLTGFAIVVVLSRLEPVAPGKMVTIMEHVIPLERLLLFALLLMLVLLFTVALFLDYPHKGEVQVGESPTKPDIGPDVVIGDEPLVPAPMSMARWEWHHRTRLGLLIAVIVGTVFLTSVSLIGTVGKPEYEQAVAAARKSAERAVELASGPGGIPPEGAMSLLRNDPATQGPKLFAQQCASCHAFAGHDGTGNRLADPPSAPDLHEFASRKWIEGVVDPARVDSEAYYGPRMKAHKGKMVSYVKQDVAEYDKEQKEQLRKVIKALSADAALPSQAEVDAADAKEIAEGRKLVGTHGLGCTDCHTYNKEKGKGGPDLTGYGSRVGLTGIISNPAHPRFYGMENDRMPAFGEQQRLTPGQIGIIADWLRGDWYRPGRQTVGVRSAQGEVQGESTSAPAPSTKPEPGATTMQSTTAPSPTTTTTTAPATTTRSSE